MKYKRILLKLSGEALMGDQQYGIDPKILEQYANEIKEVLMKAVFYYRETLKLVSTKDRAAEGRTFGNLGNTYYLLGDFEF